MMRTIEVLLVITIIIAASAISSYYAVLPEPRNVSPVNLNRLALTVLQSLDTYYNLSNTVFEPSNDPSWGKLQTALSACLPPDIVYNLTVYYVLNNNVSSTISSTTYTVSNSISNAQGLGVGSDASSYVAASSNVTFNWTPGKINSTLYILNCSDANGWWITGYTVPEMVGDLYSLLSPYFPTNTTVIVQNTTQLEMILNNQTLQGEQVQNAIVINPFGESVPMPADGYYNGTHGYDTQDSSYALYFNTLGYRTRMYNWTWVSIVGYPFYYVSNTGLLNNVNNTWGIYGETVVGDEGLLAFLQGLDNQTYFYNNTWITNNSPQVVNMTASTLYYCNYYGIYPSSSQTATRALNQGITTDYALNVTTSIFNPFSVSSIQYNAEAVYRNNVSGGFLAVGVARTPDIRLTALGLLCEYKPTLGPSNYNATDTSRLVVLQLGQVGGV
jgi:hypothetical protein